MTQIIICAICCTALVVCVSLICDCSIKINEADEKSRVEMEKLYQERKNG